MDRGNLREAPFEVRELRPGELEGIGPLRSQIQGLHHQGRPDFFRPPSKAHEEAAQALLDGGAKIWVAVQDGAFLGYAVIRFVHREDNPYLHERSFVHVEEFCVAERHRRKGVGHALMEAIRRSAQENGYTRVELDAWSFNESALRFYEAEGFRPYRVFLEENV